MIYLDNAATTKPCGECVKAVSDAMETSFGNASSLHKMGTSSINIINRTKQAVLKALSLNGAPLEGEIIFTSG
ncbi:MAG: aminotransferase class V-fold PLP-dependent enzyme, partial [Oscillospiraceae bacterium]|nr:aminotransferase class V-fold PLP-dependent enzyme [Oscillospiraceae bacterium]